MYRSDLKTRDKGGAIAAVIAIHAALLLAFLNLSGKMSLADPQKALQVFDLTNPPPPEPPPPPPPQRKPQPRLKEKEGASAPRNIKSEATEVKAPKPKVAPQRPNPVVVSETPRKGAAPTQGSAPVAGPGTGAGGAGTGTGSGTGGSGPGGGGDNGVVSPPRLATPVLRGRDFPPAMLDRWPRGATVFMRLRIDARGYVSECTVDRGTGIPAIDAPLCNIVHDRLRYRPALNRSGQAVAGWAGYAQPAPR